MPEEVIGPPVKPVPVATLVTVPAPAGEDQVPSPRRKLLADGVPVALILEMGSAEIVFVAPEIDLLVRVSNARLLLITSFDSYFFYEAIGKSIRRKC